MVSALFIINPSKMYYVEDAKASVLARSFSLKHDFPTEWHRFVSSTSNENLKIVIKKDHFPYIVQGFEIKISKIGLFAIKDGALKGPYIPPDILDNLNAEVNDFVKYENYFAELCLPMRW